jgi:hypothetical protein
VAVFIDDWENMLDVVFHTGGPNIFSTWPAFAHKLGLFRCRALASGIFARSEWRLANAIMFTQLDPLGDTSPSRSLN